MKKYIYPKTTLIELDGDELMDYIINASGDDVDDSEKTKQQDFPTNTNIWGTGSDE